MSLYEGNNGAGGKRGSVHITHRGNKSSFSFAAGSGEVEWKDGRGEGTLREGGTSYRFEATVVAPGRYRWRVLTAGGYTLASGTANE